MVVANQQRLRADFRGQMPIAEVPREARQTFRCFGADLHQRFRRRFDQHNPAGFEQQPVAIAQRHRLLQVQQEGQALGAHIPPAPTEAVVEVQRHHIAGGALHPTTGGQHLDRAGQVLIGHGQNRK